MCTLISYFIYYDFQEIGPKYQQGRFGLYALAKVNDWSTFGNRVWISDQSAGGKS